ncbi:hypothetical protein B0J17DRAFT_631672 [Rhizoctonia solani]|nr:hypothetical protein B0J17DRAFT_631672 [Rhizoctonia solani]
MSFEINIRKFATSDVILSVTTEGPMLFRYDMICPPDILQLINAGRYGMQWLHGIPDQYIIILARINVLTEELRLGATASAECVAEIENQIQEAETSTEHSADPVSMVWKYTIWECWRLTMYICLYMYIRLLEVVKSGREPDAFLYIPIIIKLVQQLVESHYLCTTGGKKPETGT